MGLISCQITSLVINSLGDRHTQTHPYTHTDVRIETILKNWIHVGRRPVRAWFNQNFLSTYILHISKMYLHQLCLPMQLHTYYTSLLGNVDALLSFVYAYYGYS